MYPQLRIHASSLKAIIYNGNSNFWRLADDKMNGSVGNYEASMVWSNRERRFVVVERAWLFIGLGFYGVGLTGRRGEHDGGRKRKREAERKNKREWCRGRENGEWRSGLGFSSTLRLK